MKLLFHVDDIRCSSCVSKLEKLPALDNRVLTAQVYFAQNLLEVNTQNNLDPEEISRLISKIGFNAKFLDDHSLTFEKTKLINRKQLLKLAVAGFSAGNIMLLSAALYTGADGTFRHIFSYLSLLLFLPLCFYSTLDIHKSALAALKLKTLNIDLPISVAFITGFVFSTYNLIKGHYDFIYYDSIASFIFLILSSRFILEKLKQEFYYHHGDHSHALSTSYEVLNTSEKISPKNIAVGTLYIVNAGEIIPVDSEFVKTLNNYLTCEVDKKSITGEFVPVLLHSGVQIPSGAKLISETSVFKALVPHQESLLNRIKKILFEAEKSKSHYSNLADKASHYLIFSVFISAILFFIYYYPISPFEAFQRSFALLIVACPCALALGTPLAYLFGIRSARKNNILIKNNNVFDKLLQARNLCLDKTGTLTSGKLKLTTDGLDLSNEYKNLILNLEMHSHHPIAHAIRKEWGELFCLIELKNKIEMPGVGITAQWQNKEISIRKSDNSSLTSSFYIDGNKICDLSFQDSLVELVESEILMLPKLFQNIYLITGDSKAEAFRVADKFHIPYKNVSYDANPFYKQQFVISCNPAVMVGDGINDALAIQNASVGIAASGAMDTSLKNADVYFLKPGISNILKLLEISKNVRKTLISNLSISFFYNLAAGIAALAGYIDPLIAAILMPISSLAIILNTKRGLR